MLRFSNGLLLLMTLIAFDSVEIHAADKAVPAKFTLIIRGVRTEADVKAFRSTLSGMKGIRLKTGDITKGDKPKYFTKPIAVEILDTNTTNVGKFAAVISKVRTSGGKTSPPKANLALFTDKAITEPSVMALRAALRDVNGLEVDVAGGLGGFPRKDYYWVQLEDAGGAILEDVQKALIKAGLKLKLVKPK